MGHKRDWKQYNQQLINRGNINFWVHPQTLENWKAPKEGKPHRPLRYSDALIKSMIYIRFKFHLSLRETEGFFQSFINIIGGDTTVPSYTQVCRRMKRLPVPAELLDKRNVTDIVLDTTGLKVYGEGEWRAEKYGGRKKWKKLHLALDMGSGKLVLAEMTDEYVHDTKFFEEALKKSRRRKGKVLMDGIADSKRCYDLAKRYNKSLLTPPKKGAVFRKEEGWEERNDALRIIKGLGNDQMARSIWSKFVGYNRRVEVESMMSRWKRLHGSCLKSRSEARQRVEVRIKAEMINQMIDMAA